MKDIEKGLPGASVDVLANDGTYVYFDLREASGGEWTVWRTDGTAAGTRQLPMQTPSWETNEDELAAADGALYYISYISDPSGSMEVDLFKSTPDQGMLLHRFQQVTVTPAVQKLTAVGDDIFFEVQDVHDLDNSMFQLWKTDGTPDGTAEVTTVDAGGIFQIGALNGRLVFTADDGALWTSDGTAKGTYSLGMGSRNFWYQTAGDIYVPILNGLEATDGSHAWSISGVDPSCATQGPDGSLYVASGATIWRIDGAGPAVKAFELNLRPYEGIENIVSAGDWLYINSRDIFDGGHLYRSDGTAAVEMTNTQLQLGPSVGFNGALYTMIPQDSKSYRLTRIDGDGAQTIAGLTDVQLPDRGLDRNIFVVSGRLFVVLDGSLFVSDGTADGTISATSLLPVSDGPQISDLTDVNGVLFFTADDDHGGRALWTSDGTDQGTVMVRDFAKAGPSQLTAMDDQLFFLADDGTNGPQVWASDGTDAGTFMLGHFASSDSIAAPAGLCVFNDRLYFGASDGIHGTSLWSSDGTPEGTKRILDLKPGNWQIEDMAAGDDLYFDIAYGDWATQGELWKSDGTAGGVRCWRRNTPRR